MKYECVTTCNAEQWEKFGKASIKSFIRHWPANVRMKFYNEDLHEDHLPIGIITRELPQWFRDWKEKYKDVPDASGRDPAKNRERRREYDFKRDCIRFGHKVGAFVDAAEQTTADILIWMDADILTDRPVDEGWLNGLFPNGFIAWLDRDKTYPECGFFMVNMAHESTIAFIQSLRYVYESGNVFKLPQTHDSYVIEWVIKNMVIARVIEPPVSLSGQGRKFSDPFSYGPLSKRMQHLKGKKKHEKR